VAGLLDLRPDDGRLKDSFALAERQGLDFEFGEIDLGPAAHPNSTQLELSGKTDSLNVRAASIGGGSIQIQQIDLFSVDIPGTLETLVLWHLDAPGFLAGIMSILAFVEINAASLRTSRLERGEHALTVIEIDGLFPSDVLAVIGRNRGVERWARLPVLSGL